MYLKCLFLIAIPTQEGEGIRIGIEKLHYQINATPNSLEFYPQVTKCDCDTEVQFQNLWITKYLIKKKKLLTDHKNTFLQ